MSADEPAPTSARANEACVASRPNDPFERAAWHSPAAGARLIGVFVAGLLLDLWSKSWAFTHVAGFPVELTRDRVLDDPTFMLPRHARVEALPWDLLDFRLVLNYGAVFGIGQHRRELFIAFTVLAVLTALWVFGKHTSARSHMSHVGLALVLAGGIGNMYDRVAVGAVRDFLHMFPRRELPFGLHWPGGSSEWVPWVFNVADAELIAGMLLLMLAIHLSERRAEQARRAAGEAAEVVRAEQEPEPPGGS